MNVFFFCNSNTDDGKKSRFLIQNTYIFYGFLLLIVPYMIYSTSLWEKITTANTHRYKTLSLAMDTTETDMDAHFDFV